MKYNYELQRLLERAAQIKLSSLFQLAQAIAFHLPRSLDIAQYI
jgi:hypothetical protein